MTDKKKNINLIVGARPNFMKASPLMTELLKHTDKFNTVLIHTGQHYDYNLSQLFFEQLKMPKPDIYLGIGSGTHAEQTGNIMISLEKEFLKNRPDVIVLFGDINSTLAAAVVAAKLHIKQYHVEAGLRSFDNTMPEEINRIVTDRLSDLLFATEQAGVDNLKHEGVPDDRIEFVGNIMIDSLINNLKVAQNSKIMDELSLSEGEYAAMTLHRPATVDNPEIMKGLLTTIDRIARKIPIIFPCHPRTKKNLEKFNLLNEIDDNRLRLIEPMGYLDFLKLQSEAKLVLTDSGGVQGETTFLKIPCLTVRENTELPVTVEVGSNIITGLDPDVIEAEVDKILSGRGKQGEIPKYWDGKTAERITNIIIKRFGF